MLTRKALELVQEHHAAIDRHTHAALCLIGGEPTEVRVPLAHRRWGLVRLLRRYSLFKRMEIYDPAIMFGDPKQAHQAEQLREECQRGWMDYCRYVQEWSSRDVAAMWPVYSDAMRAQAYAIRGQLDREEQLIGNLLAGSESTRHLRH